MSCNDILEKLEKEGIISAEGVIDSYLLCKHAEELFGKSYLKKNNEDDFYINIIKFYFNNSKKILQDKRIAAEATIVILENNNLEAFWTEYGTPEDGAHKDDISCGFDMESDEKKAKDLLINYGFILQESKPGFWITGVKE